MSSNRNDGADLIPAHELESPSEAAGDDRREDLNLPRPIPLADAAGVESEIGMADHGGGAPPNEGASGLSAEDLFADIGLEAEESAVGPAEGAEITPEPTTTDEGSAAASATDAPPPAEQEESQSPSPSGLSEDSLFEGVEAEPVADETPSEWSAVDQARVDARIKHLEETRAKVLEGYKRAGEDRGAASAYERTRQEARQLVEEVADIIDALSERPEANDARQALVDAYFRLKRAVDQGKAEGDKELYEGLSGKGKRKEAEAAAAAALARRARDATRGSRALGRGLKLAIFLGVLVAARMVLFATAKDEAQAPKIDPVQTLPDNAGVISDFERDEASAKGGSLVVRTIVFTQSTDGLQAKVICVTEDIEALPKLQYTYTWFENDEILAVGSSPSVSASKLRSGAKYHVEVKATDGEETARAASQKLVFDALKPKDKE